jgi:phenylpropionate dioxygenase-like ring-hydroxylating dioxygenase large terminal subunit
MIPNQWYVILESTEVSSKPVGVLRLGEKMAAWRDSRNQVHVVGDRCPHRGASLAQGKVMGDCLQCPFHGFEFDADGRCTFIPAHGRAGVPPKAMKVHAYPVREAHGYIWIWWGEQRREYPDLPWFTDLDDTFSYARYHDMWPVHYTRGIENQLDAVHLPFVHATTIGRGNKVLVDGPIARLNGEELDVWVHNRVDDGSKPKLASDLPEPLRPPSLRFLFPNLWMNNISSSFKITVSFIPVDDSHTLFYLRNWAKKGGFPPLAWLIAMLAIPSGRVILNQDKRVVVEQRPIKGELKMGEILIPGDGPIILYRKHRDELKGN